MQFRGTFLLLLAFTFVTFAQNHPAWKSSPFTGDPAEMRKAADSFPKVDDSDVQVLLIQRKLSYQPNGAVTFRFWRIYRILTADGANNWGTLSADWEPWHEQRPRLRARTIDLSGQAHPIDPATIAEATTTDQNPNVLSDVRRLTAPIPALVPGAVVEEEIEIEETRPTYSGGSMRRFSLDSGVPIQWTEVIVDAPSSLPLRYRLYKLNDSELVQNTTGTSTRLSLAKGPFPAVKEVPPLLPFSESAYRMIAISTGESWQKFAAAYSAAVDAQLEGANLKSWVANLKGTREEKISALMARLHQEIRYTGIEFGEAAIIPAKPSEVLKRKLGDCKDKSALLVALLRVAGIPADIALLNSGSGLDIHPDLPGGGVFNHAIVYLPGSPDYWIDATDDFAQAGQIGYDNQGRWALVANASTTALKRIPHAPSSFNHSTEIREFFLPPLGKARIVETTRLTGSGESGFRASLASRDRNAVQKGLKDYTNLEYLSESLKTWSAEGASNLTRPFELRLELDQAARGTVDNKSAAVGVLLSKLSDGLPDFFLSKPDAKAAAKAPTPIETSRTLPYYIREPYSKEWVYRIHVPDGFRLRKAPAPGKRQLGAATLQTTIGTMENGVLEARFAFDTGKDTLTPEEALATRDAIVALRKEPVPLIEFEQAGEALLSQGKPLEALAEFQALCKKFPASALERTRLARALNAVGLGEQARQEARKATELEPKSATAWYTLGMILQYDLIGRLRQPGFDYDGSISAYQKALQLDPEDVSRADFAILLEHNPAGVRYASNARLSDAIAEYKSTAANLESQGLGNNLLFALVYARRFEELRTEAAKAPINLAKQALTVVATSELSSPKAALAELATWSLDDSSRRTLLQSAANILLNLRNYPAAAEMFTALARNASNAAAIMNSALIIGKTTKYEDRVLNPDSPEDFAYRFLVTLMSEDQLEPGKVSKLFSKSVAATFTETEIKSYSREFRKLTANSNLPRKTMVDIGLASARFTAEGGKDSLARIRMNFTGNTQETIFASWEDNQWKLFASSAVLYPLGDLALRHINSGELAQARKLLDWAREFAQYSSAEDPLQGPPFARLYQRGQELPADALRTAAAALVCVDKNHPDCLALLRAAREKVLQQPDKRVSIDMALFVALQVRDQWKDLDPLSAALLQDFPRSDSAFSLRLSVLLHDNRIADCRELIKARFQLFPDDPLAIRAQYALAELEHDYKAQRTLIARLEQLGKITSSDLNSLIWATLVDGTTNAQTVEQALRAAQMSPNNFPVLHSASAILAQQGKTNEALATLIQAMQAAGMEQPESECWLVLGRIAQELGFPELAKSRYARLEKPKTPRSGRDDFSSHSIAQKWMAEKSAK